MSELLWVVDNQNRQALDIVLSARVSVSPLMREREPLSETERVDVVAAVYYQPTAVDLLLASGLAVVSDTLYYCEFQD